MITIFVPVSVRLIQGILFTMAICVICPALCLGQSIIDSVADADDEVLPLESPATGNTIPQNLLTKSTAFGLTPSINSPASGSESVKSAVPRKASLTLGPDTEATENYLRRDQPDLTLFPSIDIDSSVYHLPALPNQDPTQKESFNWRNAINESLLLLGFQHAFRIIKEPDTLDHLDGPFFRDYFRTVASLRGWDDGDPFITNYIGHPMMGAITGFIRVQNDPAGMKQKIEISKAYRDSRLKALVWSAVYSLQFELGPISEASIGNVGLYPRKTTRHPMGYVDLVVTPVVGTSWLVGEDALDRYLIAPIERRTNNRAIRDLARSFLNPTRSIANLLRFQKPWHRDTR